MRKGSLWSNVGFNNFALKYLNWIRDLLEFKASESTQLVRQWCFFFHYSLAFLATNWGKVFKGLLFLCICRETRSENTGLWQLPIVSSVFNWNLTPINSHLKFTNCLLHTFELKVNHNAFRWIVWTPTLQLKQNN